MPARSRVAIALPVSVVLILGVGCRANDNVLGSNPPGAGGAGGSGAVEPLACHDHGQTFQAGTIVARDACTSCVCLQNGSLGQCTTACPSGGGGAGGGGTAGAPGETGGSTGATGQGGAAAAPGSGALPCDVYAAYGVPCVAAHSTVRALSSTYGGSLYQVRRSDGAVKDIGVSTPGGFANAADQDAFCAAAACTIAIIYDQSGHGNDLARAPAGMAKATPGNEADATAASIVLGARKLYGVHVVPGVAYRNSHATGTATGDDAETEYMIAAGDVYNAGCCFDYGNVETGSTNDGAGAAEAIYFGSASIWGRGAGSGPWVMGDLENGLWAGNVDIDIGDLSLSGKYVTAMLKGDGSGKNHWTIKAGSAQSGALTTMFDGPRPTMYNPMHKEGGITLGAAGDNSNAGQGDFFEGVMTTGFSANDADDAVQANIVSVYGP